MLSALPAAIATSLIGTAAMAEDREIEEIVVTAQKKSQSLQSIPISIRVLDEETLDTIVADSLDEIVRLVPSLSMTDLSRGGNNVQIRGLGSNVANVGTVAIYNDGVISASRIQSGGTFGEQDSAIFDVKRVEVLRGPQGTLYGEGSFGGVINIISNQPNAEIFESSVSTTYFDTDGSSDTSTDVSGMVNIPLVKDKLAVRVVGYRYDHSGYIDAVDVLPVFWAAPPVMVEEDANTEKVEGGRMMVAWTPNETFDATVIFKQEETTLGISSYDSPNLIGLANMLSGTNFRPEYTQAIFGPDIGANTRNEEGILTVNADTRFGSLTSITAYGDVEQTNAGGLAAKTDAFSQEVRLSSNNDSEINYTVGANYRSAERDIDFMAFPFLTNEVDQWAIFGQAYVALSDNLEGTFGLRYGSHEVSTTDEFNGLPTVKEKFQEWSPKIAVDWTLSEDTMVYASVAKGFRAGGTNVDESMGTDVNFVAGFDPDTIWNYEIGTKTTFLDGRATLNVAVFTVQWQDIQIDQAIASLVNPPMQFIVVNGEDAHSTGIEADLFWRPTENWDITLGGSLVEAEFDSGVIDTAFALDVPLKGQTLASAPEYLFNASVERRFALSDEIEGYARADYTLRGNSYGDVPNQAPPGGSFESGELSSLNLRAGLRLEKVAIQLFATNVTNEYQSSFNWYDGGFGDVHVALRPRTIGFNVKMNLN